MKFGIDFGTTHTVVAVIVRGNPVKAKVIPLPFYKRPKKQTEQK